MQPLEGHQSDDKPQRKGSPLPGNDHRDPLLTYDQQSARAKEVHNVDLKPNTLKKLAHQGTGPALIYIGRKPYSRLSTFDAWIFARMSAPVRSTAERKAQLAQQAA